MKYRCEAPTVGGFVQQVAVSYLPHGYLFYVSGVIPETKDPAALDEKLIDKYRIAVSRWSRARRRRTGAASVQYLRHRRFFLLAATHGEHEFFAEEAVNIRDFRETPLKFGSYAISHRGGHAHVRIVQPTMLDLKAYFLERCCHRSAARLAAELASLPFEPYAPVRRQFLQILSAVNAKRREAGFEPVARECLRFKRRIYKVFEDKDDLDRAA